MDNAEAMSVLAREMARYRATAYAELVRLLGETTHIDTDGPSGTTYQVEVEIMWDGPSNGDLLVMGAIDDGGWRAFLPLTDSFILRPDGTFVGE
jgi:hypothetical protein